MGRPKQAPEQVQRRQFTLEFKQEAVRQIGVEGRTVSEVARRLGIRREMLAQWQRTVAGAPARPAPAAPAEATPASRQALEQEVRRLKKRVAELEEEAVILGKATAYFAKRHG